MKRRTTMMFVLVLVGISSAFANVSTHKVAVLYNKKSSVNKDTLEFMGDHFKDLGKKYTFRAFKKPNKIVKGEYKTIIILNTGVKSGVDPVLLEFIDSWHNKSEIIIVSLVKGSRDYSVKTLPAENNPSGVDVITSASLWNNSTKKIHSKWINELINILQAKN